MVKGKKKEEKKEKDKKAKTEEKKKTKGERKENFQSEEAHSIQKRGGRAVGRPVRKTNRSTSNGGISIGIVKRR